MEFISSYKKAICCLIGVVSLASCTQYQVAERALDFNRAIESATNRILLLNAVRASKRYPMHFSDVTSVTTTPEVSGTLGFELPFGADAMKLYQAEPSLTLSHKDAISMGPLNKQEFYIGITKPVDLGIVSQYILQGWPPELLLSLFIEEIRIDSKRVRYALFRAWHVCTSTGRPACRTFKPRVCGLLNIGRSDCDNWSTEMFGRRLKSTARHGIGTVSNDPEESSAFAMFQTIVAATWVLDLQVLPQAGKPKFGTKTRTIKTDNNGSVTEVAQTQEPALPTEIVLSTRIPNGLPHFENPPKCFVRGVVIRPGRCIVKLKSTSAKNRVGDLSGSLRSPQGMLFYLGELINAQIENRKTAPIAEKIFRVDIGSRRSAAVTVRFEGTIYSIPKGTEGQKSRQALALINQILNLHKKGTELPATPTVISVGN